MLANIGVINVYDIFTLDILAIVVDGLFGAFTDSVVPSVFPGPTDGLPLWFYDVGCGEWRLL